MMYRSVCVRRICATCNQADKRGENALALAIGIQHDMDVDEDGRLEMEDERGRRQDETTRLDERNDETEDAKHDDIHSGQNKERCTWIYSDKIKALATLMMRERQGQQTEYANMLSTNLTTREVGLSQRVAAAKQR